jgi:hypothetical protein
MILLYHMPSDEPLKLFLTESDALRYVESRSCAGCRQDAIDNEGGYTPTIMASLCGASWALEYLDEMV